MTDDEKQKAQKRLDLANWRLGRLEPGTPAFAEATNELAAAYAEARKLGLGPDESERPDGDS